MHNWHMFQVTVTVTGHRAHAGGVYVMHNWHMFQVTVTVTDALTVRVRVLIPLQVTNTNTNTNTNTARLRLPLRVWLQLGLQLRLRLRLQLRLQLRSQLRSQLVQLARTRLQLRSRLHLGAGYRVLARTIGTVSMMIPHTNWTGLQDCRHGFYDGFYPRHVACPLLDRTVGLQGWFL